MCGLCGMLGPGIRNADLNILEELAYISGLRGLDGAGVFQAKYYGKKNNQYILEKSHNEISYFKWFHRWTKEGNRKIFNDTSYTFFAVHTRAATKGDLTTENAHPFEMKNIVGMHNGTLKDDKYQHKTKTDSELLIADIDSRGIKPVLSELRKDSAYALVLYDKRDDTVSFVRNEKREIHFCINKDRSVAYWASEAWMLRAILGRNGEQLLENTTWRFKPNIIYKINPHKFSFSKTDPFDKINIYDETTIETSTEEKKNNVIPFDPPYKEKQSQSVIVNTKKSKIPRLYCCNPECGKELTLVDRYFGSKISDTVYLCRDCEDSYPNFNTSVH